MAYEWNRANLAKAAQDVLQKAAEDETGEYREQLSDPAFAKEEVSKLIDTAHPDANWEDRVVAFAPDPASTDVFMIGNLLPNYEVLARCTARPEPVDPILGE